MEKRQLPFFWLFILFPFATIFTFVIFGIVSLITGVDSVNFLNTLGIKDTRAFAFFVYGLGASTAFLILYCLLKNKGLSLSNIGFRNKLTGKAILFSFTAFLVAFLMYLPLKSLLNIFDIPMYWNDSRLAVSLSGPSGIIFVFLGAVVLGILGEDSIFRGFLLSMFRERFSLTWAVIFSVFIFTIIHIPIGPGITIYIIPWGFISCYLFIKFDSVYPCFLFHFLNNSVAYIVLPLLFGS